METTTITDTDPTPPHGIERPSTVPEGLTIPTGLYHQLHAMWTEGAPRTIEDVPSALWALVLGELEADTATGHEPHPETTVLRSSLAVLAEVITARLAAEANAEAEAWDAPAEWAPAGFTDEAMLVTHHYPGQPAHRTLTFTLPEPGEEWVLFGNDTLRAVIVSADEERVTFTDARLRGLNREQRRNLPPEATAEQSQRTITFLACATKVEGMR